MVDVASAAETATEILNDVNLVVDLISKITANIAAAKEVLATNPDETVAQQIADAKAKLATIQAQAVDLDAEFDAALAAATSGE